MFLNPRSDLVIGRTGGDQRTEIAIVNLGKIQPALIERAIGMVFALPIQNHCAAFIDCARSQHIASQRSTGAARELLSIPQIAGEQFHFFKVLSRHVLFRSFLYSVIK
jgi:hypothetical protein